MKIGLLAVIAATLLTLATVGHPAHSQTTTGTITPTVGTPLPTPSVTGTAALPAAQDLLNAMMAAMDAKNSYHVVIEETGVLPKKANITARIHGDVSVKPALAHEYETMHETDLTKHPAAKSTTHEQIILVKKKVAIRQHGKAWQCTTVQTLGASTSSVLGNLPASTEIQRLTNLGSETVDNIAAWDVHATVSVGTGGTPQVITSDYYISQADNTLVRETASGTITLFGITVTEHVTSDYSSYGEAVQVKLPKACGGKALEATALSPELRQPLRNSAIWLRLVSFLEGAPSPEAGVRGLLPDHR